MGGGLSGIGADGNTGTGLVISAKGAMTGMGLTNTATSTGVGFAGGNFGTGKLISLEKGNAAAGALLTLRGFAGGTNGLPRWRNSADSADMGWIHDGGAFNLAGLAEHHTKWDHGSAFDQRMYAFSGTAGQFWTTALQGSAQSLLFRAGQSGAHAKGAETLTTILEIKGGARLGFSGATADAQKARVGALTDSSGGKAAATIAAAGAAYDQAAENSFRASIVAKINALEAVPSCAGGGFGLTA